MSKIFNEDACCLRLQLEEKHNSKENGNHIGVVSAPTFMNQFIEKLESGEVKIEACPQVEVGTELSENFIIQQLESYQRLLSSEIIEKTTKNERVPVKTYSKKKQLRYKNVQ